MKRYKGLRAADGIAVGRIRQIECSRTTVEKCETDNVEEEKNRFIQAREQAANKLRELCDIAVSKLSADESAIFEGWILLARDIGLSQEVMCKIEEEHVNAEYALHVVISHYVELLSSAEDHYMRERASDIREVEERILAALSEKKDHFELDMQEACILVSEEINPEDMIRLERSKVLAFVMAGGSTRSHAAIMARVMGIPAVVAVGKGVLEIANDTFAAVNGFSGELYEEPTKEVELRLEELKQKEELRQKRLHKLVGVPTVTKSGRQVHVMANISSEEESGCALENDAQGVGLFRSEWLYLERSTYPSEEMQYIAYSTVLKRMKGKRVTIRTLDVGGDKKADYMNIRKEENPALGLRGIRVCLEDIGIFRTQLRALYRSSVYGNLAIMFPMIASVWEVRRIKELIEEVKQELSEENIGFRDVELGLMIETPAAALISDELASEVDFFSIGTNDLTQYTLAADRQNPKMETYYDSLHESVMRLIELTARNAREKGVKLSVCGELGADLRVTQQLLDMGITIFSVNPNQILALKEKILECD